MAERSERGSICCGKRLQVKTAEAVVRKDTDYLFSVKDNQEDIKDDIEEYVQDGGLRATMDTASKTEIRGDRKETRTAYASADIGWIPDEGKWENLSSFGAIHTSFVTKNGTSNEWHYYISSQSLTANLISPCLHYITSLLKNLYLISKVIPAYG